MSDQNVGSGDIAGLSEARSGFIADFNAAMSGNAPEPAAPAAPAAPEPTAPPAPTAPAAPAPSAAPTPTTAAPVPPVAPTPAVPAAPITIDTTNLSDEAKRFLQMFNGDVQLALSKGLEYNNRLGKNGEAAAPADPAATPDPNAPPATPATDPTAPPAGPMQVTQEQFDQAIARFTRNDPKCLDLDTRYEPIVLELEGRDPANGVTGLDAAVKQLRADVAFAERYAELPHIKADEYQLKEALADLREKRADLNSKETRQFLLSQQRQDIQRQWLSRRDSYARHLNDQIAEQHRQHQEAQTSAQLRADAAQSLRTAWQPALEAAMASHGIPKELLPHFDRECRRYALANQEQGILVDDVNAFALEVAQEFSEAMTEMHRVKSAEYARAAAQRTAQTTTGGPVAVVPSETTPAGGMDLDARLAAARQGLRSDYATAGR